MTKEFSISEGIRLGGESLPVLFSGPCVIESEALVLEIASRVSRIANKVGLPYIFKASYDKANRTSLNSFRGPGLDEGLRILEKVHAETGLAIITDVHSPEEARSAADVVQVLQIPAFLCRQTDLLVAAAKTGKPVNVKKGQFLAPSDVKHIIGKLEGSGCTRIMITERGSTFGYHQLVVDFIGFIKIRELGYPVILDATHSVQSPGGLDGRSGGEGRYAPYLAWAGAAVGLDGLFVETHPDPETAMSDGPNMIPLDQLEATLARFKTIAELHS